jgi:two-component system cell cycle response regulator CpdR
MAHIILAEDDSSMRQFLELALKKAGHEVTPCADGQIAFDTLRDNPTVDLLLTDIVMPGMDGLELSRKAVKLHPALKVMFITGFAAIAMNEKDKKDSPVKDGQIMSKPFHLKDLVQQVEITLAA